MTNTSTNLLRKNRNIILLVALGLAIGAYLAFFLFSFINNTQFNYVLAEEGMVESSFNARAVITREEAAVHCSTSGYVLYSHTDGTKMQAGSIICTIIEDTKYGNVLDQKLRDIYEQLDETVSSSQIAGIKDVEREMQALLMKYQSAKRQNNYSLLYDLETEINKLYEYRRGLYILSNDSVVLDLLAEQNIFLNVQSAARMYSTASTPCIVEYRADGYEGWTSDDIHYDFLTSYDGAYQYPDMTIHEVKKGDLLYRAITSQVWDLTFFVTKNQVTYFTTHTSIEFIMNGSETLKGKVKEIHTENTADGTRYKVVLEVSDRMEAYANDRFADITIVEKVTKGIKLSESCIVEESYYVLPIDYLISVGSSKGVYMLGNDGAQKFVALSILLNEDNTAFYFRLSGQNSLAENAFVVTSDGTQKQVAETAMVKGVYVVNTGSAVFTPVTILAQDNGYVLVSGLIKSDRIQLNK